MDETSLQDMLARVVTGIDPPIAEIVKNAQRKGRGLRQRRRVIGAACSLTTAGAVAAGVAGVPALARSVGPPAAHSHSPTPSPSRISPTPSPSRISPTPSPSRISPTPSPSRITPTPSPSHPRHPTPTPSPSRD